MNTPNIEDIDEINLNEILNLSLDDNLSINTNNTKRASYKISHLTKYCYQKKIDYSINALRLYPQNNISQQVHEWEVKAQGNLKHSTDGFGNICHHFNLFYPTDNLVISANGVVTSNNINLIPNQDAEIDPCFYLQSFSKSTANSEMQIFALDYTAQYETKYEKVFALMQAIHKYIKYSPNSTNTETAAQQAFTQQAGVCQDFSHIFLACARSIGIPVRYVSGYFYSPEQHHLASHAWIDAAVSNNQWLSLDVTNNITTNHKHIRIAVGPEYKNIAPIKGIQLGGEYEKMSVDINIQELS